MCGISISVTNSTDQVNVKGLWEIMLGQGEGRRALIAAAVALLKWAEEEILSAADHEAAMEVLCSVIVSMLMSAIN